MKSAAYALGSLSLAAALATSTPAEATERALNLQVQLSSAGTLVATVGPLPKGLFNSFNLLDRTKSRITLTYDVAASSCEANASSTSVSSVAAGTFIEVTNPRDQTIAYMWTVTLDLSGYQSSWHNHLHCDGTLEVHGCADARTVIINALLNNPGAAEWGSDSTSALLASVQGADDYEQNCSTCDEEARGDCRALCNASCPSGSGQANARCRHQCSCSCAATSGCDEPGVCE